jgi:hypothetical protein
MIGPPIRGTCRLNSLWRGEWSRWVAMDRDRFGCARPQNDRNMFLDVRVATKVRFRLALTSSLIAALAVVVARDTFGQEPSSQRAQEGPLRVLFVGKSYTYVNGLPWLLEPIAAAGEAPRQLHTKSVTQAETLCPGVTLARANQWEAEAKRRRAAQGALPSRHFRHGPNQGSPGGSPTPTRMVRRHP